LRQRTNQLRGQIQNGLTEQHVPWLVSTTKCAGVVVSSGFRWNVRAIVRNVVSAA
jgi:hypothetical protein